MSNAVVVEERRRQGTRVLLSANAILLASLVPLNVVWFHVRGVLGTSFDVLAGVAGFAAYVAYFLMSFEIHTRSIRLHPTEPGPELDALRAEIEWQSILLSDTQAILFDDLVRSPQQRMERISQTVELRTRVVEITTNYTLRVPGYLEPASVLVLPIDLQLRGGIEQGLEILDPHGRRLSSLGRQATIVMCASLMRLFVGRVGADCLRSYTQTAEPEVLSLLCSDVAFADNRFEELTDSIAGLEGGDGSRTHLVAAIQFIRHLRYVHPLVVVVRSKRLMQDSDGIDPRIRVTVRKRAITLLRRHRQQSLAGALDVIRDSVRHLFGVRPMIVSFPLY